MSKDEELIDGYMEDIIMRGWAQSSLRGLKSILFRLRKLLGVEWADVGEEELKALLAFCRKQNLSAGTVKRYFNALSSFLQYLEDRDLISRNPVPKFRRIYLRKVSEEAQKHENRRQIISEEQMAQLINSIIDPRGKAIVCLLAKTGIRNAEAIAIDLDDIDWVKQSIKLKEHPKRTHNIVFFDNECDRILKRWLRTRKGFCNEDERALFITLYGKRLTGPRLTFIVNRHAEAIGLHEPHSKDISKTFTPHCCRHWFTTHLLRRGMRREYVKELRGDKHRDTVDIYNHIDREELRKSYIAHIPQLGI